MLMDWAGELSQPYVCHRENGLYIKKNFISERNMWVLLKNKNKSILGFGPKNLDFKLPSMLEFSKFTKK